MDRYGYPSEERNGYEQEEGQQQEYSSHYSKVINKNAFFLSFLNNNTYTVYDRLLFIIPLVTLPPHTAIATAIITEREM